MQFFYHVREKIGQSVRYKLLVLVLFPILLVMPIALAAAIYWGKDFTYDQLFIKVKTDLTVSHDVFERIQRDYLGQLERTGESLFFRTALINSDNQSLQQLINELQAEREFSYLYLVDSLGNNLIDSHSGKPRNSNLWRG
ncbi:MAG: two-component system NtrC family sensor kinase, partial [Gammaproteobacteria bacterium]